MILNLGVMRMQLGKVWITDLSDSVFHMGRVIQLMCDPSDYFILITKNPKLLAERLKEVANDDVFGIIRDSICNRTLIEATITGLGGSKWEPNVISPKEAFDAIPALLELVKGKVALRYDPIISLPYVPCNSYPTWIRAYLKKAKELGVLGVTTSVMDLYPHAKERIINCFGSKIQDHLYEFHHPARTTILNSFLNEAQQLGVEVRICCEQGMDSGKGGCDWPDKLVDISEFPKGCQRGCCGCIKYKQMLTYYDKCEHGCLYCYRKEKI
jgi:hypothetical protein